jgi:hypothetical protein
MKSTPSAFVGEALRGQDHDRRLAAESGIAGAVDLAHPARPERPRDLVWTEAIAGCPSHVAPSSVGTAERLPDH